MIHAIVLPVTGAEPGIGGLPINNVNAVGYVPTVIGPGRYGLTVKVLLVVIGTGGHKGHHVAEVILRDPGGLVIRQVRKDGTTAEAYRYEWDFEAEDQMSIEATLIDFDVNIFDEGIFSIILRMDERERFAWPLMVLDRDTIRRDRR